MKELLDNKDQELHMGERVRLNIYQIFAGLNFRDPKFLRFFFQTKTSTSSIKIKKILSLTTLRYSITKKLSEKFARATLNISFVKYCRTR
jgi:hypothetical protein